MEIPMKRKMLSVPTVFFGRSEYVLMNPVI
jgi:hypothetical protein